MSEVLRRIHAAADAFDWRAVDQAASDFVVDLRGRANLSSKDEYGPVLEALRDHRRYAALVQVIDELLSADVTDPAVVRLYGQVQIEQRCPAAALATLTAVAAEPAARSQWVEAGGSIGRCHKAVPAHGRSGSPGGRAAAGTDRLSRLLPRGSVRKALARNQRRGVACARVRGTHRRPRPP